MFSYPSMSKPINLSLPHNALSFMAFKPPPYLQRTSATTTQPSSTLLDLTANGYRLRQFGFSRADEMKGIVTISVPFLVTP